MCGFQAQERYVGSKGFGHVRMLARPCLLRLLRWLNCDLAKRNIVSRHDGLLSAAVHLLRSASSPVGPRYDPKYPQSDYSWYRGWCSSLDVSRDRGACFLRPLHK